MKSDDVLEAAKELKFKLQDETPPIPMLRRMKEYHLEGLPDKSIKARERQMSEPQTRAYDEAVMLARDSH